MSETPYKEVYYHKYCRECIHFKEPESNAICNTCLTYPVNLYSHKPINFDGGTTFSNRTVGIVQTEEFHKKWSPTKDE